MAQRAIFLFREAGQRGSLTSVEPLQPPDSLHLRAAIGWLELGNPVESNEELERIAPLLRAHPDVLEVRSRIFARAKKWEACVDLTEAIMKCDPHRPDAWIHRSYALHELKRTQEAFDSLLPVVGRFPEVWMIPYNLACYCAQLGRLDDARAWLETAMAIDKRTVQRNAIDDPDLKPLWASSQES